MVNHTIVPSPNEKTISRPHRWRLRSRRISPEFFHDDVIGSCRIESRLLLTGLWCLANRHGWLPDDPIQIALMLPTFGVRTVEPYLAELSACGLISRANGLQIANWSFWQGTIQRDTPTRWQKTRRSIFERDAYVCQYCGTLTYEPHCDHIVPLAAGGTNDASNLTTACSSCNQSKHARDAREWVGAMNAVG